MADIATTAKLQSFSEIKQYDFDFSAQVVSPATIVSAIPEHTPPSGAPSAPTLGTIVANVVPVRLGPLTVAGTHKLTVLATHSDGAKSEAMLVFTVIDLPT